VQEFDLRELVLSPVGEEVLLQPPGLNGEEPGDGVRGDKDVLAAHTESAHVTAFKGTGSPDGLSYLVDMCGWVLA
jgi:hypothetical protein